MKTSHAVFRAVFRATGNTLLYGLLSLGASSAFAQWQWLDASGKKVFSDSPPPPDIADKNILKRPAGASAALNKSAPIQSTPATPAAGASAAFNSVSKAASAPRTSGKDIELEKKKAQAEAEEEAKKKAEEQKNTAIRAENCERAQRNLTSLQSGVRLAQVNAQGEREYLTDEARQSEVQRTQGIVASECKQ
jgi:hypothetical protein